MNSSDSSNLSGRVSLLPVDSAEPTSIDPLEQVNFRVPRGTRLRIKRLALDQGGINMTSMFLQMLDDYERRFRSERW